jgi:molybdate transport system permease protein
VSVAPGPRASIVAALAVLALYAGLIVSLAWFLDGGVLSRTLFSERSLFSVQLSLAAATVATALALLLAIPAAYALSRHQFPGKEATETVLEFPIILETAVEPVRGRGGEDGWQGATTSHAEAWRG